MILMLDLDCLGSQFFFGSVCGGVGVGVEICPVMLYSEGLSNIPGGNLGIIYHKQLFILIEFSFETRLCDLYIRFVINTGHFPFYCSLIVYNFTSSPCIFQWCTCVIMMNNIDHFQYLFPKCFCMACPLIHVL